jgi:hypothetical protein
MGRRVTAGPAGWEDVGNGGGVRAASGVCSRERPGPVQARTRPIIRPSDLPRPDRSTCECRIGSGPGSRRPRHLWEGARPEPFEAARWAPLGAESLRARASPFGFPGRSSGCHACSRLVPVVATDKGEPSAGFSQLLLLPPDVFASRGEEEGSRHRPTPETTSRGARCSKSACVTKGPGGGGPSRFISTIARTPPTPSHS